MAGIRPEIWSNELVTSMNADINASFLGRIPSYSQLVQRSQKGAYEVIHLADMESLPEVLINNEKYPIGYQDLPNGDLAFTLDKYQTVATPITDDEARYVTFNKISAVQKAHKVAILAKKYAKAVHALAPLEHTTETPVLLTSGESANGKKRASIKDIIELQKAFTNAGVPVDNNRVLVLSSDHLTDLLIEDKDLQKNYVNTKTGTIQPLLYGFNVYTYSAMPSYTLATKAKTAFGQLPTSAETKASIAFYAPDMFRAMGSTTLYYDKPETQNQRASINYRHYFLVAPKRQKSIGALLSAAA